MTLSPDGFYNGLFASIYVIMSFIIGATIALKYIKHKDKNFIFVGFTWIGIASLYTAVATSFFLALIFEGDGLLNYPIIYLSIAVATVPVTLILWFTAITNFLFKQKQKMILIPVIICAVILEIVTLVFLSTDYTLIGILESPVDTKWSTFMIIYLLSLVLIMFITGMLFARQSLSSNNPEVRLKGKLIMIAFILWVTGAILDSVLDVSVIRLIMSVSAIIFYLGFILPNWLKKILLK